MGEKQAPFKPWIIQKQAPFKLLLSMGQLDSSCCTDPAPPRALDVLGVQHLGPAVQALHVRSVAGQSKLTHLKANFETRRSHCIGTSLTTAGLAWLSG